MRRGWLDLLIFVLFLNVFLFRSFGLVAAWMIISGLWILLVRVFETKEKTVRWAGSIVIGLALLTDLSVNSPEKSVLLILVALATMFLSVYLWLKQDRLGGILEFGLSELLVIKAYLQSCLRILRGILVGNVSRVLSLNLNKKESSPWLKSILTGVVVGLPVVSWLLFTLTKADPIFATFVKEMVSDQLLNELPWRMVISLIIFIVLVPSLLMGIKGYNSPLAWLTKVRWGREMTVITGMVALVLGSFLVVQWPYVFASVAKETELIKYGVATYSEYVTKGFWDLLKVVVLVFGVAWASLLIGKNQKGTSAKLLLMMQGLLGVEAVIFVVSIFRRVWLYQSYHGLSLARLYGLALLILLAGMMVTMAMRYTYTKVAWVKVEIAWILVVVFGTIWINMESLVVKNPPTVNERVDYVYLSRLSGDGYPGWKMAYADTSKKLQDIVDAELPGIGVDHRREVFYGGLVLSKLSQNYDRLVWRYGSDAEVKEYLRTVVDWEEKMLRDYPEIATSHVFGGRDQVQGLIDEVRSMIESDDWGKTGVLVSRGNRSYSGTYTFSGYDASFYGLQNEPFPFNRRLSPFDAFLSHNPQDQQLYLKMKTEISIAGILQAIENYWIIRLQIITQPETERMVEIDISLDSPFLR